MSKTAEEYAKRAMEKAKISCHRPAKEQVYKILIVLFQAALDTPMLLTNDKPEEKGWYWYQFTPEDKPEMVYVEPDLYFGGEGKILIAHVKNAPGRWSHQILPPKGE